MNKIPSFAALASAALIASAAGPAWSDEATPQEPARPAIQTPAPMTGYLPGWYPPHNRGPYARPVYPRAYTRMPPYYRPRGGYREAPGTPVDAPASPPAATDTSDALKLAQQKLDEKSTQLDMAQATLEQLHGKLQYSLEAERTVTDKLTHLNRELKASQARITEQDKELETASATLNKYRQQLAADQQQGMDLKAEHDHLRKELETASATLNKYRQQLAADRQQGLDLKAEHDRLRDELASREQQLSTSKSVLQAATEALQQETASSSQQLSESRTQADQLRSELTALNARLAAHKASQLNSEQMLTTVIDERDRQQADLADCSRKLSRTQAELMAARSEMDRTQAELMAARSEMEALHQARSEAIITAAPPAAGGPATDEPAAAMPVEAGPAPEPAAEVVALHNTAADSDEDGIADSDDLCAGTQQGRKVDATGCEAGVAIKLEGVNFQYNSHELTDEARDILERVAGIISQQPDLRLEVAGHTDATGDPSYNQWLSMQRAEAVREYLVAKGVNPRHIGATGYGGQRPIADNDTLEGLRKNRRVELRRLQ